MSGRGRWDTGFWDWDMWDTAYNGLFDEVIEQLEKHSVSTNWIEYEFCEAGLADWTPLDEVLENLEK